MAGSAYTLDRDKPRPVPPKEKPCRECKVVKPNTFEFFGKRLDGTRVTFATLDVCKGCASIKRLRTLQDKREATLSYENSRAEDLMKQWRKIKDN